jgi:hypothetical protein
MDPVKRFRTSRALNRSLSAFCYGAFICCTLFSQAPAADEQSLEYQVKAAFLLNFTKFTEWPSSALPEANSPLTICIVGADPFGNGIDRIVRGEAVDGHKIVVKRVKRESRPQGCQVVFMGKTEKNSAAVLADLGPGVLAVGEEDSFLRDGGMISFVIENRRTRFDVNPAAAERAGLKLNSRLLSVARTVIPPHE